MSANQILSFFNIYPNDLEMGDRAISDYCEHFQLDEDEIWDCAKADIESNIFPLTSEGMLAAATSTAASRIDDIVNRDDSTYDVEWAVNGGMVDITINGEDAIDFDPSMLREG